MKKVVVTIQPFTVKQNILVYEDGNKIDTETVSSVDNIVPQLIAYTKKYNDIEQIVFIGAKHYNKIYGNKFQESELAEYGNNNITIKYI